MRQRRKGGRGRKGKRKGGRGGEGRADPWLRPCKVCQVSAVHKVTGLGVRAGSIAAALPTSCMAL